MNSNEYQSTTKRPMCCGRWIMDLEQEWVDRLRALVACEKWRWMPGMAAFRPRSGGGVYPYRMSHELPPEFANLAYPDPRDPATMGCLLAMLWEVWPGASVAAYQRYGDDGFDGQPDYWRAEALEHGPGQKADEPWQAVVLALCEAWEVDHGEE